MENNRYVIIFKILIFGAVATILLGPSFLLAYSDITTHPALSDETVDFFNINFPNLALSIEESL